MELKIHPFCNIFPECSEDQFNELLKDINENGQRVPGIIFEGQIIDGKNRNKACLKLGIPFKKKEFKGTRDEALNLIISLNLHRRHLSDSQRACVAAEISRLFPRKNNHAYIKDGVRGRITPKLAKSLNISQRKIRDAIYIKTYKPELFEKCKTGELQVGKTSKSIYRDMMVDGKDKIPDYFSSEFEVNNFLIHMTNPIDKNGMGWRMQHEGINGRFYCHFYGLDGIERKTKFLVSEANSCMKRSIIMAIRKALNAESELK